MTTGPTIDHDLLIVGGRQRQAEWIGKREWNRYGQAVVLRLNPKTMSSEVLIEHETADDCRPTDETSTVFKSGAFRDNTLHLCTQTEILIYEYPTLTRSNCVSLPFFNDLHHVTPTETGNLLVAVTGLDMVVEITMSGKVLREWDVLGRNTWSRFSKDIDYRRVVTTKPHDSHPNYTFAYKDEIWVTRFEQKDAVCLNRPDRRIEIGIERPHDGILHQHRAFFSTVDGHIVIANMNTAKVERVLDLNQLNATGKPLGWTRGLFIVDDDLIIVGASALRETSLRRNLRWVKHKFTKSAFIDSMPTHIALYDISKERCIWREILDDPTLDALFYILPVPRVST